MGAKYIYRMDDVTPDMDWNKFELYLELFKKYKVKPLLGIVPENKDKKLSLMEPKNNFWDYLRLAHEKGFFEFAQHGYQHLYVTNSEGLLKKKYGYKNQSEFAGLDYLTQYMKILKGKEIMEKNGFTTDVFMAPSHSFDDLTLRALYRLDFKYVTDGLGLYPFVYNRIKFIPQQSWSTRKFRFGIITICLHTNTIRDDYYLKIEEHLKSGNEIISFSDAVKLKDRPWYPMVNYIFKNYSGFRYSLRLKERLGIRKAATV